MNVHVIRFNHQSWCLYCFELLSQKARKFHAVENVEFDDKKIIVHLSIKCFSRSISSYVPFRGVGTTVMGKPES